MAKLAFLGEKFGARVYEFVPEKTTVGRGDHNTLVIRDDSVSNAHCEILVNGPEVIVHDLGSANGTFVNGARVNGQSQVKDGQVVRFGSVEARLDLGLQKWEETATEETAVYAMQRIMRDQRRERAKPKPADPSMTLESPQGAEMGDHTVLLTRPASAPAAKTPLSPEPPPSGAGRAPVRTGLIVAAALISVAVLLCWLRWWIK
jgi:predicted component of type VI protein secretion system